MIVLYDENTTSFDNLGIGVLSEFKTIPTITEVLKGEYILEFEYPKNVKYTEYLTSRNIIKALGQAFRIDNVKPTKDGFKVLARHIVFDLRDNYLIDTGPTKKTAQEALNWILEHSFFKTNFYATGDCTKIESARYVRKKLSSAFWDEENSILNKFGGEPEYDNYHIILHNFRGKETGIEIREKKNLTGFDMNIDLSTVKTKIMPVGKDGLLLPEKFVDSPLINNYNYPKMDSMDLEIGLDENTTEEQAYELMRNAVNQEYNNGLDKPKISLQVDFVELSKTEEYKEYKNLETVELGDNLRFYMPSLNQKTNIRVIKTVKNALNGRIISLELGNEIPNIVTSQKQNNQTIKNQILSSALTQAKLDATNLINHPFNGHLLISKDTGELYIMDTTDIRTAQRIWKWGLGGLGFSSTGINGTYVTAWTQDGGFVADFITTGTMSVERIEGLKELLMQVQEIENLIKNEEFNDVAVLNNCKEGKMIKLSISGKMSLLFPSKRIFPSKKLFSKNNLLIIESEDKKVNTIKLPIKTLRQLDSVSDEFVIESDKTYLIQRIGLDEENNLYLLEEEKIIEYQNIDIELKDGVNKIYLNSFQNDDIKFNCKYVCQSNFTDVFALKTEVSAQIEILKNQINISVSEEIEKATETEKLIAQINLKPGKIDVTGTVTANENFKILADGSMEARNGKFSGHIEADSGSFKGNIYLQDGSLVVGGNGMLTTKMIDANLKSQQFVGANVLLPMGFSYSGTIFKDFLEFNIEIPQDFYIISAYIILDHIPVEYYESGTYKYTGYSRNLKLYKSRNKLSSKLKMDYGFANVDYSNANFMEVENTFGANGFTGSSTSGNSVQSTDIKNYLDNGFNLFKIESANANPSDYDSCLQQSGACKATMYINGYTKFS